MFLIFSRKQVLTYHVLFSEKNKKNACIIILSSVELAQRVKKGKGKGFPDAVCTITYSALEIYCLRANLIKIIAEIRKIYLREM